MSVNPSNPSPRPQSPRHNGVAIACILSGGLIAAAIINSHKPAAPVAEPATVIATIASRPAPPIAQESARQQFETQTANQDFKPVRQNGVDYYCQGVSVIEVDYSAKEDQFTIIYKPRWRSNAGADSKALNATTGISASNDGYGHYTGAVNLGGSGVDARVAYFTLR